MKKQTWQERATRYCQRLNGVTRARKHYRCGTCYARRSLHRELWQYLRAPKCHSCGQVDWTIDLARTKEHKNRTGVFDTCDCGQMPHPHRKGSTVWCAGHPTGPTEDDYRDRHGEL